MIKETEDLSIINTFLKEFNYSIDKISTFEKFLIFLENDKEIGFLDYSIIYDRVEINYILVNKKNRNNNIATKLLNCLVEIAKQNKCINISLEVNENNIVAINFYKKNKFKEVARRKNYYNDNDGLLMVREMV